MHNLLLLPLLMLIASCSLKTNNDNDIHKMCLQAKDYSGCVNSMNGNADQIPNESMVENGKDKITVDLEFEGMLIGQYHCKENKFKINNSSTDKPFTSFEYDKWYGETEFVEQFRQAGSTTADAQNAFVNVQGLRTSSCSTN